MKNGEIVAPLLMLVFSASLLITIFYGSWAFSFGQRCAKIYEGAAHERCVARMAQGGPLYEENIGLIK